VTLNIIRKAISSKKDIKPHSVFSAFGAKSSLHCSQMTLESSTKMLNWQLTTFLTAIMNKKLQLPMINEQHLVPSLTRSAEE
jgi:hypothetical protein